MVSITGSYTGNYNTSSVTSSCTGTRSYSLTGLDNNTSAEYIFNGTYTRKVTQLYKSGSVCSNTSNITVTLTNTTVNKSTKQITGGTGTVVIDVLLDNNNGYLNLTGNIVFNGDNTATLTFAPQLYKYNINL